jgi:gliding motility-associated-like protein
MNRILQILILFGICFKVDGQIININAAANAESNYGPERLIKDVLISNVCSDVDNFSFQVKGSPTQRQTKSYGYFKKPAGSKFPFDDGIVITNGIAFLAGNTTNTAVLIDNDNSLAGDSDLEAALGQSDTFDATYIKFNFTPLVDKISFRFLMASEEYDGATECVFADSFAFLLRELGTTTYKNLAVLPSGTPVSVTNINKSSLINNDNGSQNCDANTNYFEGYNLIETNYGGRTKVLTATSNVIPNKEYEIKLVVADQGDSSWDSAIFLEAGSFNIGVDLGEDITLTKGNHKCLGEPVTLDASIGVSGATYKWFFNGVEIPGANSSIYNAQETGDYGVEVKILGGGCSSTDQIRVEFALPPIITAPPNDMLICEIDNNFKETFNFTNNRNLILGTQSLVDFPVSFHKTQADAQANQNVLPLNYTNTNRNETIWVRIADKTQVCYKLTSFTIEVQTMAVANAVSDCELCDDTTDLDDTNGIAEFDLSTKTSEALGAQLPANFDVKFYHTQAEANLGSGGEIMGPIRNTVSNPQTVYVRIENKLNKECFDTTKFNLIVHPLPVVMTTVSITQCDSDIDGVTLFNLTEANNLISTNYLNETITYYELQSQAETGLAINQITNFISYPNQIPFNDNVFARIENANGCYKTAQINLVVGTSQIPTNGFDFTFTTCDDKLIDNDATNGIASFDFTNADTQFRNQFPLSTITYYTNEANALAETNAITDISNHRNDASPGMQKIYVRIDSNIVNGCLGLGPHITLTVNPLPTVINISDYKLCSDTDQAVFNLSVKDAEINIGQPKPLLISYHFSEQDAINNIVIPNSNTYTNASNPQTIWVRAHFDDNRNGIADVNECYSTNMKFNLVVNSNPTIFSPKEISICNNQVNTNYDLTLQEDQITGGDNSIALTYFESQLDLDNNNPIPNPTQYTSTTLTKNILVLATNTNSCTSTTLLPLKTILYANIEKNPAPIEECEVDNNGFDFFNITRREVEILNGLYAVDFTFTYYEHESDAIAGNLNNIVNVLNFENTTKDSQTIYVRVQPKANKCYIIVPLQLIVNSVPKIAIDDKYVICLNNDNTIFNPATQTFLKLPPIDTRLNTTDFTFQWYKGTEVEVNTDPASVIIVGETNSLYMPLTPGYYTVIATNKTTGCNIPATAEVVVSYPPKSITVELISPTFSSNNIIEVTVIGNGEYEFKLDNGSWQRNSRFENVTSGEHTIYVRDLFNCNVLSQIQTVIDYPRYFTPNSDGYHDTWNISTLANQTNSKIYIFDRYGKLVKQLSPNGEGWDGTLNGRKLPSNDYWFVVDYEEPRDGIRKQFKAHFTLKR